MGVVIVLVKLFWKKPEKRYKWEPMKDDLEEGTAAFPMVLVQIPMFNEREVSISLFSSSIINLLFLFFLSINDEIKSIAGLQDFNWCGV